MMSIRKTLIAVALAAGMCPAASKLNVVTTTEDLAAIGREIGGDHIAIDFIAKGYQDPHFVEPKPSFLLKLQHADLLAVVGLQLEIGWLPPLITQSGNSKIQVGNNGYLDVSTFCEVLELPTGVVTRADGDVHPLGNPHYWLDPENGRRIARLFKDKFTELDPAGAAVYSTNEKNFEARLNNIERTWTDELAKIKGQPVVAWHTSWRYFAEYTKMNIVGFMEPKPGVPPSPSHLAGLIQTMRRTGAKVIVMEPFYDQKTADFVASRTGAKVLILPPSVGGVKGVGDYISVMDYDIKQLAAAL